MTAGPAGAGHRPLRAAGAHSNTKTVSLNTVLTESADTTAIKTDRLAQHRSAATTTPSPTHQTNVELPGAEALSSAQGVTVTASSASVVQPSASISGTAAAVSQAVAHPSDGLTPIPEPNSPADSPLRWAVAAITRKDLAALTKQPPTGLAAAAAQQLDQTAQPIGIAPGIVVTPTLFGHYTLTAGPNFSDQLLTFGLSILKNVSNLIGVNLAFALSNAIASADPPFFTTLGLKAQKTQYTFTDANGDPQSWKVWEISPSNPTDNVVIAVHGGGLTIQPNLIQWLDYAQMARDTGATVVVPIYPLTQNGGQAAAVVPAMADFITQQVADHGAGNVSIYADSAGGDIAILAVQQIVRNCAGDAQCLNERRPARMVLLSPALTDASLYTDPNVKLVDDPVESAVPEPNPPNWQGDLPDTGTGAELFDPTQGSAADLPQTSIYVGSLDILAPSQLVFAQRMVDAGSPVNVVIGMGQIHDWALGGIPTSSQSPIYRQQIYQELGLIDTRLASGADGRDLCLSGRLLRGGLLALGDGAGNRRRSDGQQGAQDQSRWFTRAQQMHLGAQRCGRHRHPEFSGGQYSERKRLAEKPSAAVRNYRADAQSHTQPDVLGVLRQFTYL